MKTWILKTWNNEWIRDRVLAILHLILMFANFTAAYHGHTDGEKLPGLVGGMISLLVVLAFTFKDYDPDDEDPGKNPDRYKNGLR